jgi:hypothetical protein
MNRTTRNRFDTWLVLASALALAVGCGDDDSDPGGGAGAGAGGSGGAGMSGGGGAGSGGAGTSGSGGGNPRDGGSDEDAGSDPGSGMSDLWLGCPDEDDYPGTPNGPHILVATDGATYCSTFHESRTLKEELAAKAMLRIAPGSYGLPGADAATFGLPLCIRFASAPHPRMTRSGATTHTELSGGGITTHAYYYRQRFAFGADMLTLETRMELLSTGDEAPVITLDGENVPAFEDAARASFTLCEDPDDCFPNWNFDSCTFGNARVQVHAVTLGGDGNVELELHIGESFASTEPGAFVRATGTFRGQAFDQRDYFQLVYNPEHHHFVRDFAVLFDEPIDGVCGLEIARLEPFEPESEPNEAYAIDCELDRMETLTVTAHTFDAGN